MDLRITPQTLVNRVITNTRRHQARLGILQEQLVTGRRLLRPSDGPAELVNTLEQQSTALRLESYLANIDQVRSSLNLSVSSLQDAEDVITRASQIAIQGADASNNAISFEALAIEVDALIDRMLQIANGQNADRSLFAGTATDVTPFVVASTDAEGRPLSIDYQGAEQRSEATVSQSETVSQYYAGSEVFQQRQRGPALFTGSTGAAPGTGTNSATALGSLIVRHTTTSYAGGSGVLPGTSSPSGDTIIGPAGAHMLTVVDTSGTGASGTVSLNGGAAFAFTNTDTNLAVTGPGGEVVYVDTTSITPGFSGTVAITADGTLSVDGGASEIPINFSSNQIVTNSFTGDVTNVDSGNIRQAGTDFIDYTGTFDTFQILIALRDDLRNTRGLTSQQQANALSQRISELGRVREAILGVTGEQAATLESLDTLEVHVQDFQLEASKLIQELDTADITELVIELQSEENLLRLTLASAARIFDQSLLDFLR